MSNTKKTILGILTFTPLIFLILYFFAAYNMMMSIADIEHSGHFNSPEEMMQKMKPMFAYMFMLMGISIALLIIYLLDIFSWNKKLANEGNTKLIWALIVLFTGMIGMIVYFFAEIVPRKELPPLPPLPHDINEIV